MKKIIFLLIFLLITFGYVLADENYALTAGISVNQIPKTFFGTWRVTAKLDDSNSYGTFKPQGSDIWTLTRIGDIVTLSNPYTGAKAQITLKAVEENLIIFTKKAPYDNKILTDTVSIRIDKNNFKGINTLSLDTLSNIDGHVIKTETARYLINGEKIAGENIIE